MDKGKQPLYPCRITEKPIANHWEENKAKHLASYHKAKPAEVKHFYTKDHTEMATKGFVKQGSLHKWWSTEGLGSKDTYKPNKATFKESQKAKSHNYSDATTII